MKWTPTLALVVLGCILVSTTHHQLFATAVPLPILNADVKTFVESFPDSNADRPDSKTFVGAVVQHYRPKKAKGQTHADARLANLKVYHGEAMQAKNQGAQIIVFPELGLGDNVFNRHLNFPWGEDVPSANESMIPCSRNQTDWCRDRPAVCEASCIASSVGIVMVVGMVDVKECNKDHDPSCPKDGHYIFNTAVVFNEQGAIIARYHKKHIATPCQSCFDVPAKAELVTFKTSFGVEFGVFVCMDILYPDPPKQLIEMGVRNFVFPTSWNNLPPVLTATQFQQAWSRIYNATLLAANIGNTVEESGSGMYIAGQPVKTFFDPTLKGAADEKLLSASLAALQPNDENVEMSTAKEQPTPLEDFEVRGKPAICGVLGIKGVPCHIFNAADGEGAASVTSGPLTCNATWSPAPKERSDNNQDEYYAVVAWSGQQWFVHAFDLELCTVIKCLDGPACLLPDPWAMSEYQAKTAFNSMHLRGSFSRPHEIVFPMVAGDAGQVLDKDCVSQTGAIGSDTTVGLDMTCETTVMAASLFVPYNYTVGN